MARARRLLVWAGIFILGLLLGPLLLALIAGLTASADENVQGQTAYRLLKAYDERYPDYALSSRDWQSAASDCATISSRSLEARRRRSPKDGDGAHSQVISI